MSCGSTGQHTQLLGHRFNSCSAMSTQPQLGTRKRSWRREGDLGSFLFYFASTVHRSAAECSIPKLIFKMQYTWSTTLLPVSGTISMPILIAFHRLHKLLEAQALLYADTLPWHTDGLFSLNTKKDPLGS